MTATEVPTVSGGRAQGAAERVRRILAGIFPGRPDLDGVRALRDLGLDSLSAARLVLELRLEFGVGVPMAWLGDCRGVAELASWVERELPAGDGQAGVVLVDSDARHDPFPLTALQQAYLVSRDPELSQDPVGCHIYREFELADVDPARLRHAWQRVVERNPMLRVVLTADRRQRVQPLAKDWSMPVREVAGPQADAHLAAVRARLSHHRYEPDDWPLFAIEVTRRADGPDVVHLSIDAMITDGHGLDLMLGQWWLAYAEPDAPLPQAALDVRDCVLTLAGQVGGPAWQADLDYWSERLADLPAGPAVLAGPGTGRRRPLTAALDVGQWTALRKRAAAVGVSPTVFLLTVFADTLARHQADDRFSLVLTTNQRSRLPAEADTVVGPFTSSCVFVVDGLRERGVDDAARYLGRRLWEDLDHGLVSGVDCLRELRIRDAVLPVVFTSLLDATRAVPDNGFAAGLTYAVSQTSGVAVDVQIQQVGDELVIRWDVSDAVAGDLAEVLFCDYVNALTACAAPQAGVHRPLNELQQAYYVAANAGTESWSGCQVYHSFDVVDLDVDRLAAAWARMLTAYEVLRGVVTSDGRLFVRDAAPTAWRIPVVPDDPPDAVARRLVRDALPLDRWPRFDLRVSRADDGRSRVHLTIDLIVCDGRSVHFLMRELFRLYADPLATPRPVESFAGYAARSEELRRSPDRPRWTDHWRDRLADLPPGPGLPMPAAVGGERGRTRRLATIAGWSGVRAEAARVGVGMDAVLVAALTEALATSFAEPFAVPLVRWTEWAGAYRPGEYTALSWLTHSDGGTLWERAVRNQRLLDADEAADAVSGLAELRRVVMKQRRTGRFSYPVVHTGLLELGEQPLPDGVTSGPWLTCTPDVSLDCIAMDDGLDELRCFWDVVEADFELGAVDRIFTYYLTLLRGLAGESGGLPADAERHTILVEWNDTEHQFAADGPVHLMFETQADHRPEAVAVRWSGGTMTYRELNRAANGIARRLRELGVGAGSVVAVRTRRGPQMVAAVYGVLKAGGAYLPVEPGLPAERAAGMLVDAGASVLVTMAGVPAWSPPPGVVTVAIDELAGSDENPPPVAGADDPAYIIYTSGSTGKPKGVLVTHRPLHNLFSWCQRMFCFDSSDVGLCVTSLGFDLSVFDLLGLLGRGASVYVASEAQQRDPAMLLDVLLTEPVTFWNSAPTTLAQLAALLPAAGGQGTGNLRLVFLSGDYTPLSLPAQLASAFPRAKLVSLGGATEATVWSNWFPVESVDPAWRSIPYGRPIDNCRYYILDERLEPCRPGQPGDLYIAGTCLSQGYVNRPDLTGQRFITDPHASRPGELMYRTGDRASYFPDGNICFLGRLDDQVKIRGFRVELGELEHRLRQHPAVGDVVVTARQDAGGDRKLIAYVMPATKPPPPAKELRQFAATTLPDYMVPNFVAFVDTFPATSNGKLDRDALPWPVPAPAEPPAVAPVPSTGPDIALLTGELIALFTELVGVRAIDADDDLWDVGATSFTMVQASAALAKRHGQRVPVSVLISEPTVRGIARAVAAELGDRLPAVADRASEPPAVAEQAPEPPAVDFFDPADRSAFKDAHWNLRPRNDNAPVVALPEHRIAEDFYRWRATRRDFTDEPVALSELSRLLGLLRPMRDGDRDRYLYPSAGDTYAVQVYVRVLGDRVTGLPPGSYHYRPAEHSLELVNPNPTADRSAHFFYNRETYNRAAFQLHLVGQLPGIEPLYGADSGRYLALEAGHLAQLLMTGQAGAGIGLCPIGAIAENSVRADLELNTGHRLLYTCLGGRASHSGGDRAPYTRSAAVIAPTDSGARPRPGAGEVAVTGLSGRYPGAEDLDELWRIVSGGRRAVGRLDARRLAALGGGERLASSTGGFLADLGPTDSMRFGITAAEASTLDPRQLLLLEAVARCMDDAGYTPRSVRDIGRIGVFVGSMWPDFLVKAAEDRRAGCPATASGLAADLPNRVSHVFGFTGPSIGVDTSCASSLTAVHLAIQSIRSGECDAAVVAGINLVAHPFHLELLSDLDLVSATGDGGAFDADASGWSPGEGVGVMLLRPAGAAIAARDVVHGVIEQTGSGHSGTTARFGAPDARGLADSLRHLLGRARLTPADIDYIECAAAGAAVADAVELEAIGTVFAGRRAPVAFGSVKPNIGHLEAASGMSQLAKVLLQLRHGGFAPTVVAASRSPLAVWDPLVLRLVEDAEPWPAGGARRALVNALGATGSYAHVVVRAPGGT